MNMPRLWRAVALFLALCVRATAADCTVVHQGSSQDVLFVGTVLTSEGPLTPGYLLVQSGKIARMGNDTACRTIGEASVVECKGSVISPGFINTHEHIDCSTINPFPTTGTLYDHRHEWRVGLNDRPMLPAPVNGSETDAIKWGELRHIFSGTTSIVGNHMAPGLARNLDFVSGLEDGLESPADTYAVFPLDDAPGIVREGDCDYGPNPIDQKTVKGLHRYIGHVAEGIGAEAQNEFRCLSDIHYDTRPLSSGGGRSTDIIAPNVGLVHALGLSEADFDLVAERNATVVWSPRSNVALYGKTLNVTYLLEAGITVALGTDWLPSGSATMGREALCGLSATHNSYGLTLESKIIWEMMTINGAKVAGFDAMLGSIEVGKLADIVIFGGDNIKDPFGQAIYAAEEDIELVMRGGKVLVASHNLKHLTAGACESATFGHVSKTICVEDELGNTYKDFEASLDGVYPAILPGVPPNEPSCDPIR